MPDCREGGLHDSQDRGRRRASRAPTGVKEAWTLTCEDGQGKVLESRQVVVDRGQRVKADMHCKPKK